MDTRLAELISDYQACVAEAVAVLEKAGFQKPASDSEWPGTDGPPPGTVVSGYRFYKHGVGCTVHGPNWSVDFDFGEQGKIDGIGLHRLKAFAERNLSKHEFESVGEIDPLFADAVERGSLRFSGYILYYVS